MSGLLRLLQLVVVGGGARGGWEGPVAQSGQSQADLAIVWAVPPESRTRRASWLESVGPLSGFVRQLARSRGSGLVAISRALTDPRPSRAGGVRRRLAHFSISTAPGGSAREIAITHAQASRAEGCAAEQPVHARQVGVEQLQGQHETDAADRKWFVRRLIRPRRQRERPAIE